MEGTGSVLAEIPGFGRVFDCGGCGFLHLTVGPVSLTLTTEAYVQLVAIMNTSAASFETWVQTNRSSGISALGQGKESRGMEEEY